ncbi:hypothetical protein P1P75_01130 [Streptomyces sp. ID05-39B]|uniref:hypothetical protein n=1 Tax=Streptomyces sp. ID05-39B TaxID=3028664 RepID=UPI0029A2E365|nr:hypothetical protein [Streptomyces sp. ID05-39B]MDX3525091.1 hypothetical protein [Streptomyces sp. ID05-39B]
MDTCTYDLDHSAVEATHYYKAYEGDRVMLCFGCASRFGYPQYLVELPRPRSWRTEYGYLVNVQIGTGQGDLVADVWPMEGDGVESWLTILGCQESKYLVADAAWEPYRPHYSVNDDFTYEATRVTCLPVVQCV